MTRGGMALMLGRLQGVRPAEYRSRAFTDVSPTRADAPFIAWAAAKGIASGVGENRFDPDAPVTREQLCTFLYRCIELRSKTLAEAAKKEAAARKNDFKDAASISSWARESVEAIAALGLIQGSEGRFRQQDTATRAEMAAILLRVHNLFTTFSL